MKKALARKMQGAGNKIAWFHCASLGEFEQGRPLIETFHEENPGYEILLTFFSPSGYEIRKNYKYANYVSYLPLDSKKSARYFIQTVKPSVAFFIKYEFWYFLIHELNNKNIPTYLVSGIFRASHFFFQKIAHPYCSVLHCFEHIFVQDNESKALLSTIGVKKVSVTGDTRFDRVQKVASQKKEIPFIKEFKNKSTMLIGGSTWPKDEDLLIQYINRREHDMKYILAPHEINEKHLDKIEQSINKPCIRYSNASSENVKGNEVLLMDNIGMLSSLYQYGDIAYVGGGFGAGIHNILEAATFGIPVVFGPNHKQFNEANELIHQGGAFSISNYFSMKKLFDDFLADDGFRKKTGNTCKNYIKRKTGSTREILNNIQTAPGPEKT